MSRGTQVLLEIRTALLRRKLEKLEIVGWMRTRVTAPMNSRELVSRITKRLFATDQNHLVLDTRDGMTSEVLQGKTFFTAADPIRDDDDLDGEGDGSESDDDQYAWPAGLPTFSLVDVLEEAKRISTTVRLFTLACASRTDIGRRLHRFVRTEGGRRTNSR